MDALIRKIGIDKKKGYIGAIIGLILFVVCLTWYNWYMGVLFAVMFPVTGFVKLKSQSIKWDGAVNVLGGFLIVALTWLCSMAVLDVVGRMGINLTRLILNFLIILAVCFVFMVITANWRASMIAGTFILILLCVANGFIFRFRGKELAPLDFLSVKTALNVASEYKLGLSHSMFYGIVFWGWSAFALFSLPKLPKISALKFRIIYAVADVLIVVFLFLATSSIPVKLWDSQGTRINGYFLNFFLELRDSAVDKPNNYSSDRVKDIFDKHTPGDDIGLEVGNENITDNNDNKKNEEEKTGTQKKDDEGKNSVLNENYITEENNNKYPNILVIMDESFADFRVLGENFNTCRPVTPFIDSLTENTIKGYALTSVFGGNTANAEFEFLTAHSMAFLPNNSVPYQQYINGEMYSLPWILRSNGYKCVSTHPYYSSGWSRETVYPYLGFQESTFIEKYTVSETIRNYISDMDTFKYMLDYLETEQEDRPLFMFGITMQNHGGYSYSGNDFSTDVELLDYTREYPDVEQYLTLVSKTDSAVEYLINELQDFPEETIVVFFGDHFPSVNEKFFEEVHGGPFETLEQKMLKYKVPFFIWANFDIPESSVECTSLNYLSGHLLNVADITLPPFYEVLNNCETVIPAINSIGFMSVTDNAFMPFSEASPVEKDWLEEYEVLQYNNLIDYKNRDDNFNHYIPVEETLTE